MALSADRVRRVTLTLVCVFVAPLSWSAVLAGPPISLAVAADQAAPSTDAPTLDSIVARIQDELHARVVRTDVQESAGRRIYVLRLLNDAGRVWTVRVDAATGVIE